jgi:hypothetical protein
VKLQWPDDVPSTGRHGFNHPHRDRLEQALPSMGSELARALQPDDRRVLVLGAEELRYAPLRLAEALAEALDGSGGDVDVRFSTTTRSPVLAVDAPGYAIRTGISLPRAR